MIDEDATKRDLAGWWLTSFHQEILVLGSILSYHMIYTFTDM